MSREAFEKVKGSIEHAMSLHSHDACYEELQNTLELLALAQAPVVGDLTIALRQYQHNDCSGFVFGYDKDETDKLFTEIKAENERLGDALATISNIVEESKK